MRKTNPIIAPAVSPLAGPRATPITITPQMVSTENSSPEGNSNDPITQHGSAPTSTVDRRHGVHSERLPGVVGPDRLGAADHLADRPHHLAVALASRLVGPHEVALDQRKTSASGAARAKATSARPQS